MNLENADFDALGHLMRGRMAEKGLLMKQVSYDLRMSPSLLYAYFRGLRRVPTARYEQLLAYLGIGEDEIPRKSAPSTTTTPPKGKRIFISYSHKDKDYLTRLLVHIRPLERKGLVDCWADTRLIAGDKWKKEIDKALKEARAAVLLISADFMASDFVVDNELPPLLHAAEKDGTLIIPVIVKPCRFMREKNLREFQSINSPEEPLSLMDEEEREVVYDSVSLRIENAFEK